MATSRRTFYTYVLTHFHRGGITTYVFKCTREALTLTATIRNKLIRSLNIEFNVTNEIMELKELQAVRIENL